jgi:uncharacterized protein
VSGNWQNRKCDADEDQTDSSVSRRNSKSQAMCSTLCVVVFAQLSRRHTRPIENVRPMPTVTQPWKFSTSVVFAITVALAVIFALMRVVGTLGPVSLRPVLPLGFVLMAITPWLLLRRAGRIEIGLRRSTHSAIYVEAIFYGAAAALTCFLIGFALFGAGADNWFVSIAKSFAQTANAKLAVLHLYLMFTVTSMIFSPIGEEIFFRGLLQRVLEERFSVRTRTWIECLTFALVHLCHHGLVFGASGLTLLACSAPIWFLLMALVAYLFAWLRKRGDSLYPAIAAHASFNFMMGTCIFLALWPVQ